MGPRMFGLVMKRTPPDYWYILPCENFQRINEIKDSASPWYTIIMQHFLNPLYPQKSCGSGEKKGPGDFDIHHNTCKWVKEKGLWKAVKENLGFR